MAGGDKRLGGAYEPDADYDCTSGIRRNGTLVNTALTTPTLTGATITGGTVSASTTIGAAAVTGDATGIVRVKQGILTEAAAATSYTLTIPIPAGATLLDVQVIPKVLWNGTSATLKVGDTADDDGIFTGVNLKATDLLVNEVLSMMHGDLWGGKEGAYLVAATGRRGPTTTNFGIHYVAATNITFIVTPGAADGTAGRTQCVVLYSIGQIITSVVV